MQAGWRPPRRKGQKAPERHAVRRTCPCSSMVTYIITEKNQKATPFFRVVRTGYGGMYKNGMGFLYGSYREILSYFYTKKTQIGLVFLCKIMYDRDVLWDATGVPKNKGGKNHAESISIAPVPGDDTDSVGAGHLGRRKAGGWVSAASFSEGQDGHSAHQRRTWRY